MSVYEIHAIFIDNHESDRGLYESRLGDFSIFQLLAMFFLSKISRRANNTKRNSVCLLILPPHDKGTLHTMFAECLLLKSFFAYLHSTLSLSGTAKKKPRERGRARWNYANWWQFNKTSSYMWNVRYVSRLPYAAKSPMFSIEMCKQELNAGMSNWLTFLWSSSLLYRIPLMSWKVCHRMKGSSRNWHTKPHGELQRFSICHTLILFIFHFEHEFQEWFVVWLFSIKQLPRTMSKINFRARLQL
jgi:hypothetical protein